MTSKLKTDVLETVSGSGTIALTSQLSGMTHASVPSGSVLQVVQAVNPDIVTYSNNHNWQDLTGLTANITPSSTSNKILISINVTGYTTYDSTVRVLRDTTVIGAGTASGAKSSGIVAWPTPRHTGGSSSSSGEYLDSPNSTSTITYKLQAIFYSDVGYMNRSKTDNNVGYDSRLISTITLTEIKG